MIAEWQPRETTTHQDHVIAHVLDATVLGYFVFDEALYILLDIGFIWTIYLDCEMALLLHPVACADMEIEEKARDEIKADIERLLSDNPITENLLRMSLPPGEDELKCCRIKDVGFFEQADKRRLILTGEDVNLAVETSLATAEIQIYDFGQK